MKTSWMQRTPFFALCALGLIFIFTYSADAAQESKGKFLESTTAQTPLMAASPPTTFTYQGQLKDASGPVTGAFDFQFILYSAQTDGEKLGASEMKDVALTNGMFNLKLDFGRAAVEAKESWLEIGVRQSGGGEAYTILFPRQKLAPTPYAIFAQHEQWSLIGVPVGFAEHRIAIETKDPKPKTQNLEPSPLDNQQSAIEAAAPQGTPNVIAKFDGNGAPNANSIMFDNGSNVGIGTTNPSEGLTVVKDNRTFGLQLKTNTSHNEIVFRNAAGDAVADILSSVTSNTFGAQNGGLAFFTNSSFSSPKVVFASGGNVGIGTGTPTSKLEIAAQDGLAITGFQPFLTLRDANAGGRRSIIQGVNGDLAFVTNSFINQGAAMVIRDSANAGSRVVISGQDGLAINGYQPFLTLGDTNTGKRGFVQSVDGGVALLTNNRAALVIRDGDGLVSVRVLQIQGGSDLSENFDVSRSEALNRDTSPADVQPGMVVAIDPENPGKLVVSHQAYDRRVAGIVSGAGGVKPGMMMGQAGTVADGKHPVALTGRVYCWADASNGSIEPGDLLTTSHTPGHAMKVTRHHKAQGAIIGKAMTSLKEGTGLVLVLVTLQ